MTIRNLSALLRPKSFALIGASGRAGTVGSIVLDNVLARGFTGAVFVVNPHRFDRTGIQWVLSVDALQHASDLAIVMTPGETIPGSSAIWAPSAPDAPWCFPPALPQEMACARRDAARLHLLRVVGPNCLGIMAPHAGLDAKFCANARQGGLLAYGCVRGFL